MYSGIKLAISAIILLSYLSRAMANPDHLCSLEESSRMGTCGTNLADDISLVCRAVYNKREGSQIRDGSWSRYPNIVMRREADRPVVDWNSTAKILDRIKLKNLAKLGNAALDKRNAFSFISTIRKPGLVCECCVHNCALAEMYMYCGTENNK
uniref:Insulin-like peptide 1 n=1 Tax=Mizuhopecten yessoensis TaxID=6573 RepID=A0A346GAU1_MIZYE|nr:insulin-like peptide 1 [Mizuhopecten yessoensis]